MIPCASTESCGTQSKFNKTKPSIHFDALAGEQSSVKNKKSVNRFVTNGDVGSSDFSKVSIEEFPPTWSHVVELVVKDAGGHLGAAVQHEGDPSLTLQPVETEQKINQNQSSN